MQEASSKMQGTSRANWWLAVRRWLWVILWMGVIFAFSAQPKDKLDFGQDVLVSKVAHVIEYAILAWLIQRARGDRRAWWQSWLIAVAYAATDEFHQLFVPGRGSRITDVMIDAAGAAIGLALAVWRMNRNADAIDQ